MNINRTRRTITAAINTTRTLGYTTLSGATLTALTTGQLIRISTYLQQLGLDDDFTNRYASPFGRHAAKHYRNRAGHDPRRCWINRDGRWIHVFVYAPNDPALTAAVASYKRTAHLTLAA
ncbi:hypothetical protein F0L17_14235 [Streptomyces sp. TRM43335]|uniref:Uncharacterized protein n=1 Tax=Streptomyces taklimakanensis TaxID=2569853 RepID=A0A6G2BDN9_9ACTN|nr:hypothetical protein [Streptomyces taklimakanensis]MTE20246.1 hypothetical protein [Streptomyces taklimakanensis]